MIHSAIINVKSYNTCCIFPLAIVLAWLSFHRIFPRSSTGKKKINNTAIWHYSAIFLPLHNFSLSLHPNLCQMLFTCHNSWSCLSSDMMMLTSYQRKTTSQSHPRSHTSDMPDDTLSRHFSPCVNRKQKFCGLTWRLYLTQNVSGCEERSWRQDEVMKQKFWLFTLGAYLDVNI